MGTGVGGSGPAEMSGNITSGSVFSFLIYGLGSLELNAVGLISLGFIESKSLTFLCRRLRCALDGPEVKQFYLYGLAPEVE